MNKKWLLSAAIAAALGTSGNVLAVNIDTNSGQNRYASEISVDSGSGSVLASGGGDVLENNVGLGFSISQGDSKYIRYDIETSSTTFETAITAGDFSATTAGGSAFANADFTISTGGGTGSQHVIVEVNASGGNIPNNTRIVFNPDDVRVTSQSAPQLRYRLFDTAADAINANNALKNRAATWFEWAEGFAVSCTAGSPQRIDVVDPTQWLDGGTGAETVATVSIGANADVYNNAGTLVDIEDDYFAAGAELVIAGSTAAFETASGFTLGGLDADAAPASGEATWTTDAGGTGAGNVELPLASVNFNVDPDGTNEIVPSSYNLSISDSSGNATFDVGTVSVGCGQTQYSGSVDRLDFALTPNGVFRQFVRITNPSAVAGAVTVTVYNDAGDSVTFNLADIDGVDSSTLPARGSSQQININDVYAAAQAADASFEVGANPSNKLRVEVRGEFGDDALEQSGERSATERRVDGIYIQGLTVARDNNAFFQTK